MDFDRANNIGASGERLVRQSHEPDRPPGRRPVRKMADLEGEALEAQKAEYVRRAKKN